MNDKPTANVMDRVRKILTKTTEAGCTEEEAKNAFALASKILTAHNLSMDDVKASAPADSSESFMEQPLFSTGAWSLEDNLTYGIIREFFFVEGFLNTTGDGKVFTLFGTKTNVEVARFTWNALQASFNRCWQGYKIVHRKPASERRMYVSGMAKGFSDKLRDERRAMEIERDITRGSSGCTALALRNIAEETKLKLHEVHPDLKARSGSFSPTKGDQSTLDAGYKAGRELSLNRGIDGKSRTKAIGE